MKAPMTPHPIELAPTFDEHRKLLAAGPLAGWLHVKGLCYSARTLTDGFVPSAALRGFDCFAGIFVESEATLDTLLESVTARGLVARLTEAGLWEATEGGFQIHEYSLYQPTRARLEQRRIQKEARQSRWRRRVSGASHKSTKGSKVCDLPTATETVHRALSLSDSQNGQQHSTPKGSLLWFVGQLRDADEKTPAVVYSVLTKHSLPTEAALNSALESLRARRERQPALVSEARYFVATLNGMGEDGRYSQ